MINYIKIFDGLTKVFKNYAFNLITIENNNLKFLLGSTKDKIDDGYL